MSLLTSAIKGLAGVAKSDALKEAERLLAPKPGFFSKLEEAITGLNFNKMPSQQLRKTMEGRQVSPLEYDNVLGQMEGTVSKEEVMGMIGKNKTELKDVVLGEPRITEKVNMSPDRAYGLYKEGMISADDYAQAEKTGFIEKSIKRPVHYEQYSEPGYVPGSYRERFVTAPDNRLNEVRKNLKDADLLGLSAYERAQLTKESILGKTWQDGHGPYSAIQNPVVRIRYNDRIVGGTKPSLSEKDINDKYAEILSYYTKRQNTYPNMTNEQVLNLTNRALAEWKSAEEEAIQVTGGKKILFIEEMQGPSPSEQAKMPEFLRKRIYDIGVKKALMLAKEGGYDGVAWTTGEMQASRYDLSKQVNKISWNRLTPTGIKDLFIDIKGHDTTHIQYDPIKNIITAPDGGSTVFGTNVKLEDVVGKNIAEQIVSNNVGSLSGLDLKVGGEGLKYLYDKQLPSLFKKYGKGDVKELKLRTTDGVEKESKLTSVSYLPITEKTPSRHPVYSLIPPTLAGMTAMYRTGEGNAQ